MQLFCGIFCTEWAVLTLFFIPVHFLLAKTSSIFVLHLLPSPLLDFFELEDHFLLVLLLSGVSHNAWQWVVPTNGCIEEWKDEVSCSYLGCGTHTDRDLLTCWSRSSGFYLKDKVSPHCFNGYIFTRWRDLSNFSTRFRCAHAQKTCRRPSILGLHRGCTAWLRVAWVGASVWVSVTLTAEQFFQPLASVRNSRSLGGDWTKALSIDVSEKLTLNFYPITSFSRTFFSVIFATL